MAGSSWYRTAPNCDPTDELAVIIIIDLLPRGEPPVSTFVITYA